METPTVAVLPKVSELIKTSWTSYKKNWKNFLVLGAIPFSITVLGTIFTLINTFGHAPSFIKGIILVITFLLSIAGTVVSIVFPLVLIKYIKDGEENVPFDSKRIYKDMLGLFFPLLWIGILFGLICMGGSIFLIIPGIALSGYLGYYQYVLVTDDTRGLKALISSFYYVRGNWWGVFGRILALGLIMAVIVLPVVAIIGVLFVLMNGGFSVENLQTLFGTTQVSASTYLFQTLFNLVSNAIGLAVVYPIFTFYSYFIFKGLKATKILPDEQGQKKARGWFIGLSIFGAVVIPLLFISMIVLLSFDARRKSSESAMYQQQAMERLNEAQNVYSEPSTSTPAI
ncbi:MAG: hypothetical protein V4697_03700 [Patescibacteria group bacterium]